MKTIFTIIGLFLAVLVNGQTNFFWSYNATITPVVTTQAVTNIRATTATGNGTVIQRGNPPITERGSCWNTSTNPTVSNSRTSDGSGVGAFTSAMYPFTFGTTYYVRAYVINAVGNFYGDNVTFTPAGLPTVTTDAATNIATTSVTDGGNVTSDGGAAVTERGVCYKFTTNPTTANSKKTMGSGTGAFSASITTLSSDWTYYAKAYAINSAGTAYGSEITWTTACVNPPSVAGIGPMSKPWASGTAIIEIRNWQSGTPIEAGICYNTTGAPTTSDSKATATPPVYPVTTFTITITGLTPGATYHFRGYGINACGTAYGNEWDDIAGS